MDRHHLASIGQRRLGFVFTCSCGWDTGAPVARADAEALLHAHVDPVVPLAVLMERNEAGWAEVGETFRRWVACEERKAFA